MAHSALNAMSSQRKVFSSFCPNRVMDRASMRLMAGMAGRMYPGSLDFEIVKKSTQKVDQVRRRIAAGEGCCDRTERRTPPKAEQSRASVQGRNAIRRMGR